MPKATIDDLVNIGVGYGVCADTPAARASYKAALRAEGAATVAAAKVREPRWLLRKQPASAKQPFHATSPTAIARMDRKDAVAAALEAQAAPQAPAAAPAPAPAPTEYPASWSRRGAAAAAAAPAPTDAPTEYPGSWAQVRRVAAGIRVGRKAARISDGRG